MRAGSIHRSSVYHLGPLGVSRIAPVDPFKQVAEWAGRDHYHPIGRRRPHEAFLLQALGVERGAQPILPEDLDQLVTLAPEDVKVASMGIAPQLLLDAQG